MEDGGNARGHMLEPVDLFLVLNHQVERLKLLLKVAERDELAGVIGGESRALELLSQDLVAGPDALGVECGREELASSLGWSALRMQKYRACNIPSSDPATGRGEPTSCRYMEWTRRYKWDSVESAMLDV